MVRNSKIESSHQASLTREQSVEIDPRSLSLNWPLRNFNITADPVVDQESPLPETGTNCAKKRKSPHSNRHNCGQNPDYRLIAADLASADSIMDV